MKNYYQYTKITGMHQSLYRYNFGVCEGWNKTSTKWIAAVSSRVKEEVTISAKDARKMFPLAFQ